MSLYRVTITGADDAVSPWELMSIAVDYPFVEWALLLSTKRAGTPRYPSAAWVRRFQACKAGSKTLPLAAHLCGDEARRFMAGDPQPRLLDFGRVQVNGWESRARHVVVGARRTFELILQARDREHLKSCVFDAAGMQNVSILFDPSGGRGLAPQEAWPSTPAGLHLGFAGGIGPDNVVDVVQHLARPSPFWIDMESSVRDDQDRFDLERVRLVLDRVAPLVAPFPERPARQRCDHKFVNSKSCLKVRVGAVTAHNGARRAAFAAEIACQTHRCLVPARTHTYETAHGRLRVRPGDILEESGEGVTTRVRIAYIGPGGDPLIAEHLSTTHKGRKTRGRDGESDWTLSDRAWQVVKRGGR